MTLYKNVFSNIIEYKYIPEIIICTCKILLQLILSWAFFLDLRTFLHCFP